MCKKLLLLIAFTFACSSGYAQLSVSYQVFNHKIGLGYNFNEKFWTELRLFNTALEDVTPEIVLLYNISVKERHEIYIGAGGSFNMINSVTLPLGLQFRPFENFKRFSLQIEFAPVYNLDEGGDVVNNIYIRGSAGIRYRFSED